MCTCLPAELLDEVSGVLVDLLGELHHVDASKDDVVCFHRIRTCEWRTGGRERGGETES